MINDAFLGLMRHLMPHRFHIKLFIKYFFLVTLSAHLLIACAPEQHSFSNAVVHKPYFTNTHFIAGDGTRLRAKSWLPKDDKPPKAVILALHGFNDYHHAFDAFGDYLAQKDVATYAYDQRGFGASTMSGIWPGKRNLIRDVAHATDALHAQYPDTPIYVAGESMGGAVVVNAASIGALENSAGLILIAPALWGGDSMASLYRLPLWISAHLIPYYQVTGNNLNLLPTDNIALLRSMSRDSNVLKSTRIDSVYGLVRLMDDAYFALAHLGQPTLILYGAKDEIIPKEAFLKALGNISAHTYDLAYYPNAYHMVLRDIHNIAALEDTISWIHNPATSLPSGADVDALNALKHDVSKQNKE